MHRGGGKSRSYRIFQSFLPQLIEAVAVKADIKKKDAEAAVNAMIEAVTEALVNGDKVSIVGFGTFEVRDRKEKTVINSLCPFYVRM